MEKNKSGIYPAIPEAVVVGNGEFPSHPFPLSDQAPCVVCCDGGANALVESGRLPDWIVGDGDSLSEENRIRFQDRIHRIPDQETNDQTKAVSFLASQGIRRIAILGATGRSYAGQYQSAYGVSADGAGSGDADGLRFLYSGCRYTDLCRIPAPAGVRLQF